MQKPHRSNSVATVLSPALRLFALGLAAASLAVASMGAGCSAGVGTGQGGDGNGGSGSGTFSSGTSSPNGTGSFSGGTGGNASGGIGGGCAGTSVQAQKIPLDMYIMLDQSGSMTDPVAGGGDKWSAVTSALVSFLQQPTAAGLGVGIQFFGLPAPAQMCPATCMVDADCGACGPCVPFFNFCSGAVGGDSCTAADYANPATLDANGQSGAEIATLPGASANLIAKINAHSPNTSTPTSAALQGAVDHAKTWQTAHPDHVVVAVLATDGDPTECDTDLNNINAIAAGAANGNPKIRTFVIGVGSSLSALNGIAAAGGTQSAFIVDTNQNTNQQFLAALNAIQGSALSCSYTVPVPTMGTPDYGAVNVQYTPGNGGSPVLIPNVSDKAHCPAQGDAWYYDNPAAPTQIILCDPSCNKIEADTMGKVDVVLGCKTVPA
jgi:hypothetical protein